MISATHFLPFQRSATVPVVACCVKPAAVHAVADVQDTLDSPLELAPGGMAARCACQFLPFQRSLSGTRREPCR